MRYEFFGSDKVRIDSEYAYHYCSLDAFLGIVESKSFWLTSLGSTNDETEMKIADDIIKESLSRIKSNLETDKNDNKLKLDLINNLLRIDTESIQKSLQYFTFSMTSLRDYPIMWNQYNSSYTGVCIKIKLKTLYKLFCIDLGRIDDNKWFGSWLYITKIEYLKEKQVKIVQEFINTELKNLIYYNDFFANEYNVLIDWNEKLIKFYEEILSFFCPMLKHNEFQHEGEIRVISLYGDAESLINTLNEYGDGKDVFPNCRTGEWIKEYINKLNINVESIKFNNFNNNIKGYFALNLDAIWGSELISEIIIGKKSMQDIDELGRFLKLNGLSETEITKSKIVHK